MIYLLVQSTLIPGKMAEFNEIAAKELLPRYQSQGTKLVASFHSYTGNMNDIYTLYAFNDLAGFQKFRENQNNPEARKTGPKLQALRANMISTLIEPNPWSPMK